MIKSDRLFQPPCGAVSCSPPVLFGSHCAPNITRCVSMIALGKYKNIFLTRKIDYSGGAKDWHQQPWLCLFCVDLIKTSSLVSFDQNWHFLCRLFLSLFLYPCSKLDSLACVRTSLAKMLAGDTNVDMWREQKDSRLEEQSSPSRMADKGGRGNLQFSLRG